MATNGNPPRPLSADAFLREETYAATRRPVALASTLIPDAYTSPEFFQLEQERVFATSWVVIGCTSEVAAAGDTLVAEIGGQSLIVTRNADGELRAFHNVCRHRGSRLLDPGRCHIARFIKCPYHSWAYDLNGECLGTPLFDDDSEVPVDQRGIFDMDDVKRFDKADHALHAASVEEWGCLVFANLDPNAAPLQEQLGDLPSRLAGYGMEDWVIARSKTYEIAANYKLIGENFMEYYHLPWVHPGLVKVSPMKAHHRWQGPGMYTGMCTSPIADNSEQGGWKGLPPKDGLSESDATSARFAWMFPGTALNVLPNHVFVMIARPVAPGHTSEQTHLLVHRDAADAPDAQEAIDGLASFWDEVNMEDVAIVERVQEGLGNLAYTGGRMCYRFEEPLHRFQNMVIDRMLGIRRIPEGDAEYESQMFAG
ncbi:MAG: choline monooxygenase [Gaiellales bacterium]|jgi:choline monooxygenase|nr:choline monooxygenase [Gaiellales bacterium]